MGRRETERDWPHRVPYPIYPDQPGLLPWGNDENGNDYYWLTEGAPDTWRVLSDEVRGEGLGTAWIVIKDRLDAQAGELMGRFGPYESVERIK